MSKSSLWGALSLLGLSIVLAGCGGGDGDTPQGRVRVINALTNVPNNANVDVRINNNQGQSNNISFGQVDTAATTVNAGANIPVTVLSTGTTTQLATNSGLNVTQGADNLVLITGAVGTAGGTAPQVISLGQVDLGTTPVSNQARIYFVNAAPGVGDASFNLTVTNPSGPPATSTAQINNLAYGQMAAAQLVTIVDGASTVAATVTATGETIPVNTTALAGGNTYAVVLTGRPAAAGGPALATQVLRLNP